MSKDPAPFPKSAATSFGVGDATIETDCDSIKFYGSVTALRDKRGLETVRRMAAFWKAAEAALLADHDLPDELGPAVLGSAPNPMG